MAGQVTASSKTLAQILSEVTAGVRVNYTPKIFYSHNQSSHPNMQLCYHLLQNCLKARKKTKKKKKKKHFRNRQNSNYFRRTYISTEPNRCSVNFSSPCQTFTEQNTLGRFSVFRVSTERIRTKAEAYRVLLLKHSSVYIASIGLYWINTEIKQSTVKRKISKICNEIRGGGGGGGGEWVGTGIQDHQVYER